MYTLGSAEFNQIIETPNNKAIKSRLVLLDDNTIIDKIKSLILYSASCSQELQIGTTNMAYIDAEVESNLILTNREVRLECGVELSDGTVEYIPMGVFTIQKPQGDIDFVKFTANDRMQKFDYPYSSTLTYPTTDKAMLEELATMCGVTLATNIDNPITIDKALDGYTRREVLGYIAGLHGKFACFNRNGELELKWYNTDTPITKNIGLIWGFEKSDEDFTVSKIEVAKNNETTLTSGNGYGVVQHSNPLATQEIVNDLFTSLNGFTYNASVVDILDDIRLDLGDVIKVTYLDGKDYLVPCMSIKQDFGQGSTNIESFAKSDTENTYRFTGPTIQYLNRMAMELLVANRVIATKVDAEYVQSHAITTDNLDAITANITNLVVDKIDGKYADIHLANIDIADIGTFFADSGLLKDVTVVDGHITGELDAVRINADVITTGTLSVDRLLVTGKDSIVYQINVDSSGLSETELEKEVYQKYLNGTDIVANSITATQLNVSQIFADKTVTSTLFAQDIVAIGSITSPLLKSDDYVYDGETFDGEEYSTSGMIIDLRKKIIRTPKFCLKNDGSMYASEIYGSRYYGLTSTETAFIFNGFTGGTKETTDLLKVSGNTADGTTYTTYINTDNDNFSFYKPCLFPYGIKGDLTIEGNTTLEGNTTSNGRLIAHQGMYVHDTGFNNWGTAGYIVLARIEVLDGNLTNSGYDIGVVGIYGYKGEIKIRFTNTANITDTEVEEFSKTGSLPEIYYTFTKGTNSVTVDIIVYKQEYQMFRITHLNYTNLIYQKTIITYPNTYESTLRAGAVQATLATDYFGNVAANGDVIAGYGTANQCSLLGLFKGSGNLNDANDIKHTGFYITNSSSKNVIDTNGFLLSFEANGGNCVVQFNFSYDTSNARYIRSYWWGNWFNWAEF